MDGQGSAGDTKGTAEGWLVHLGKEESEVRLLRGAASS